MIVDVHTHLWDSPEQLGAAAAERIRASTGQPWEAPDASPDAHDRAMKPVEHAIILGFRSRFLSANIASEQIAAYVNRAPEKYIGFAGIDPMEDDWKAHLHQAVDLGLRGVVISPAAQDFHPTHTDAMHLYEICEKRQMPLFVHPGSHFSPGAKMEYSQPYLFDEVARSFPQLRMVIAQVGYPWVDQTLVLMGKHPNVYADLSDVVDRSWQLYNVLLAGYQQGVTNRMLLGSNFPFSTPERAISTLYSVNTFAQGTHLPTVPREQLRSIVERDALVCLGLPSPRERNEIQPSYPRLPQVKGGIG